MAGGTRLTCHSAFSNGGVSPKQGAGQVGFDAGFDSPGRCWMKPGAGGPAAERTEHMGWTEEETQSAIHAALKRAATDAEFRQLALQDANAAVQKITGKPLPEGFRVRVLERAGYDVTLVLPDPAEAGELADEELEHVAGGTGGVMTTVACGFSYGGSGVVK